MQVGGRVSRGLSFTHTKNLEAEAGRPMSNAVTGIQEERCNFDARQRNNKGNYYNVPKKAKHTQTHTNEPKNHKIK